MLNLFKNVLKKLLTFPWIEQKVISKVIKGGRDNMMSLALSASGARQTRGNVYGAIGPDSRRISKLSSSLHFHTRSLSKFFPIIKYIGKSFRRPAILHE